MPTNDETVPNGEWHIVQDTVLERVSPEEIGEGPWTLPPTDIRIDLPSTEPLDEPIDMDINIAIATGQKPQENHAPCYNCSEKIGNHPYSTYSYTQSPYLCEKCYSTRSNFKVCRNCGWRGLKKDIHTSDTANMTFCPSCYTQYAIYCQVCNKIHQKYDDCGHDICEDCMEKYHEYFSTCCACNKSIVIKSFLIGNSGWNYRYHKSDNVYDESHYCEQCFSARYAFCNDCSHTFPREELVHYLCPPCYDTYIQKTIIYNWGFKPVPIFHTHPTEKFNKNKIPLYLGFELEIEMDKTSDIDTEKLVKDMSTIYSPKKRLFYCKYDSSIEYGFEIVTHPMTLMMHNHTIWDKLLAYLSKYDCSSNTQSLHIHASRNFLPVYIEQVKLGTFVNLQKTRMEKFATRKIERYAKYKPIRTDEPYSDYKYANLNTNDDRHSALNWENNDTIEFRVFRGSLDFDYLMSRLQFVDACMRFMKTVSMQEIIKKDYSWNRFMGFVCKYKRDYGRLANHLKALGLMG